jgi:hypothetical protein
MALPGPTPAGEKVFLVTFFSKKVTASNRLDFPIWAGSLRLGQHKTGHKKRFFEE